jgi:acetyl/propionyl-CoA carboxylase alpha subunit
MFDKILIACSVGGGEIACRIIEIPDMKKCSRIIAAITPTG